VLGELTAGLAHEMNNPASALLRSVDFLINNLPNMLEKASLISDKGLVRYFFESGQKRVFAATEEQREKIRMLSEQFPQLKRSEIRVIADMNEETYRTILPFAKNPNKKELLELYLEAFQAGVFTNGIRLSTTRIEHLVKSLKSFSRQSRGEREPFDIRHGINETLMLLSSRLKNVNVELDLPEIPVVYCFAGEINQVWTNIIINACEAMENRGGLFISCGVEDNNLIWVKIADTGPGIPKKHQQKIFDTSFTTKTAGGDFGLGLGLAITKGIVDKHNGTIRVSDREGGGAIFTISLPVN